MYIDEKSQVQKKTIKKPATYQSIYQNQKQNK